MEPIVLQIIWWFATVYIYIYIEGERERKEKQSNPKIDDFIIIKSQR